MTEIKIEMDKDYFLEQLDTSNLFDFNMMAGFRLTQMISTYSDTVTLHFTRDDKKHPEEGEKA